MKRKINTELIPVIHMINENQVLTNVLTCLSCGIEKVFIINHQTTSEDLIKCARRVKDTYPNLWVGINMLDKYVEDAILYEFEFDGLWCDQSIKLEDYKHRRFEGMLFTGLAFKYQPQPKDIELACQESILTSDVMFDEISNKFKGSKLMHSADYIHITFDNEKDKSNAIDMLKDDNVKFINESVNENLITEQKAFVFKNQEDYDSAKETLMFSRVTTTDGKRPFSIIGYDPEIKHALDNAYKRTHKYEIVNESLEDVNSHVNESSYKGLHYGDITDLSISIKGKPNSEQSTLFAEISNKFKNSKLMHSASHIHITFDNEKDKSNAIDMLKDDNVQFINESLEDVNSHVNESTTSGPGTGKAADINKILDLRKNLGEHPMAIASGVNIENIDTYKGIVDYLLVASSITSRSEIIYEDKLLDLISKLK